MEQLFELPLTGENQSLHGHRLPGLAPGGVFLHGFRSNCDGNKAIALARHAKTRGRAWLRFDQRGCGQSSGEFKKFTLSQAIDDSVRALDHVRQRALLVGSSLGALIALCVAQQRSPQIAGLMLIAPAVRFLERHFMAMDSVTIESWKTRGSLEFPDTYSGTTFRLDYDFYVDAQKYVELGNLEFCFPIVIIHGANDELLPAQDSLELAEKIRGSKVRTDIVPTGDHRLNAGIPLMCQRLDQLWSETK